MLEIFILSIIQGFTEFIPVSSSSHLIVFSDFFDFSNQSLTVDVSLHIGSFFAVIVYFRKDIISFLQNKKFFLQIIVASIPVMLVGYILVKLNIIEQLRNIIVIGWTTIIFGILLFISDKIIANKTLENNFNYKSAIFIGFFQVLSLVPGVSRSGITISAGRFMNFNRYDSAKISFLLSIPTLAAVSIFGLNEIISSENLNFSLINLTSIFLSFIFSYITIKYFLIYLKKFSLNLFVIYRIILGIILLLTGYL